MRKDGRVFRSLALLVSGAVFLTSCLVGNPLVGNLARVPDATPSLKDVAYGSDRGCTAEISDELCGGSQLLDIYPAVSGAGRGTIVWIHGGGLLFGDKSERHSTGPIFEQLRRGWSVVSVNYRLIRPRDWVPPSTTSSTTTPTTSTTVPDRRPVPSSTVWEPESIPAASSLAAAGGSDRGRNPAPPPEEGYDNEYPTALLDVVAAIDWVRVNGARYGLDTSRLVVGGHSAGGMLAAMIALGWNSKHLAFHGIERPDAYITMAAPMDLRARDVSRMMTAWLGDDAAAMAAPLSPVNNIDAADPPGYVAHGDRDNVVNVHHARAMEFVYGLKGLATDVRVDVVDRDSGGGTLGPGPRWHLPGGGVGMRAFNEFMDNI
jgi:acetyl esterase/lipase